MDPYSVVGKVVKGSLRYWVGRVHKDKVCKVIRLINPMSVRFSG
jgi:hypothetical protein